MKCDAYERLIGALEKGELNHAEAALVHQHLAECENCRDYREAFRAAARNAAEGSSSACETAGRSDSVTGTPGISWEWAAAVVVLVALVALILILGPGRFGHHTLPHHGAKPATHAVRRAP